MKKKIITAAILTFAALTLVVATVFTTLAFLADSSAVSNVFTIGNVAIALTETKVKSDGTIDSPLQKVDSNSYHLTPNHTYIKDPTIEIISTNEQDKMFLFVKSSNQIRSIEAGNIADDPNNAKLTMRKQMEANGWVEYLMSEDEIEIVWVYGTRNDEGIITPTVVTPGDKQQKLDGTFNDTPNEFKLCEEFTVGNIDTATVSLYGAAKVTFTGFAIQTTGIGDTRTAWTAIKDTFPYEGGIVNPKNPYNGATGEDAYAPVPKTPAP